MAATGDGGRTAGPAVTAGTPPCPICGEDTAPVAVPVVVRRAGRDVLRLEVEARGCGFCGYLSIADETQERVLHALERHTRPGDDIVFQVEGDPDEA